MSCGIIVALLPHGKACWGPEGRNQTCLSIAVLWAPQSSSADATSDILTANRRTLVCMSPHMK
jgi:hypothetical protein